MNATTLIERILNREAVVGVIGLGYVGLPLVMEFCRAGFKVIGFDVDRAKTDALNRGESYIRHIDAARIRDVVDQGVFVATVDYSSAAEADALIICVPTPLTRHREPDTSYIESTGKAIAPHLQRGQLIVLESTTYPGTTDEVLRPILEVNGLRAGEDFFLGFSPEREDPGNPRFSTGHIPKVVSGIDTPSLEVVDALYGEIVDQTVRVSSTRAAEAVKLLENIFRSVNIALVNELKTIYSKMGIDVWEVIEAAKTKPFGFMPFYPGPGLGGHCIPIDPFYLTWKAREHNVNTRFIELAGEINSAMPQYVVDAVIRALNERGKALKGARVLVLGIAYKPDVADPRESPGVELIDLLSRGGAVVEYNDPLIPVFPEMRKHSMDMASADLTPERLAACDCVLIATAHSTYDADFIVRHASLVVDTRNATAHVTEGREKIVKA